MRPSAALFDALATDYDAHFAVPHRRAYDDLAWELVSQLLPRPPATVVDLGCGVGRWARRLVDRGYRVVGVEPAPAMAEQASRRLAGPGVTLLAVPAEELDWSAYRVDAVLAMGSLQYTADPAACIAAAAGALRPGGVLAVLVDSLVALVVELLREGRHAEAQERLSSRRGVWTVQGHSADLHLLDRAALEDGFRSAGLRVERSAGLLLGATTYGRAGLTDRLTRDYAGQLAEERALADTVELADLGKQLFMTGRRPGSSAPPQPPVRPGPPPAPRTSAAPAPPGPTPQ